MKICPSLVALPLLLVHAAGANAQNSLIAFSSDRDGKRDIYVMAPNGSGVRNVTNTPDVDEEHPAFGPQGLQLVYERERDLFISKTSGELVRKVNVGHFSEHPAFRPRTNLISYSRRVSDADIFTISQTGTGETLVANNIWGDYSGSWSPEGTRLAFYTFSPNASTPNIYVKNADGTGQVKITDSSWDTYPNWSPDGSQIVFQTRRHGADEIYIMNANGSGQTRLTTNTSVDERPVFSPDGKKIAFVSYRDGNGEIYVMDVDGSNQTRLTNTPGREDYPDWQQQLPNGAPSVTISDSSVSEPESGSANATFTLTLSAASTTTVSVTYRIVGNSATEGQDFTGSGFTTVTFEPGQVIKTITVPVLPDTIDEADEQFAVRITAFGANVTKRAGLGTIRDNDPLPVLSIGNVTQAEGNDGTPMANFPLTLNRASGRLITVRFAAAGVTATAGEDFVARNGVVTLEPGVTSAIIQIPVRPDLILEAHETYRVNLSEAVNVSLRTNYAVGAITNDDTQPGLSIADISVQEGSEAVITLTLSYPAPGPVSVGYGTASGTAQGGLDFTERTGRAIFGAGASSTTITVPTLQDESAENAETFQLKLTEPSGVILTRNAALATIVNDDFPEIYGSTVTIREGKGGQVHLAFTIALAETAPFPVQIGFATANGSATAGSDYVERTGTATIPAGQSSVTILVTVLGDTLVEPTEEFYLNLSGPAGATVLTPQLTGFIVNDDASPAASIVPNLRIPSGKEG